MRETLAIVFAVAAVVAAPTTVWAASHNHAHDKPHKEGRAMTQAHGHWSAPAHAQQMANPVTSSIASIRWGETLFQENCAICHGDDGSGNGEAAADLESAPANLLQMAPTHADGDFAWKIANGRGEMPGWGDVLTAEEIWHVVNFLKDLPRLASIRSEGTAGGATDETLVD